MLRVVSSRGERVCSQGLPFIAGFVKPFSPGPQNKQSS